VATQTTAQDGSPAAPARPAQRPVKLDTAQLKSSYCNVCNASTTREEVILNFGINQNWDVGDADALDIQLHHRIILSPYAAKRLQELLNRLMQEYESRHGQLK
jgi:hypothetical protein